MNEQDNLIDTIEKYVMNKEVKSLKIFYMFDGEYNDFGITYRYKSNGNYIEEYISYYNQFLLIYGDITKAEQYCCLKEFAISIVNNLKKLDYIKSNQVLVTTEEGD